MNIKSHEKRIVCSLGLLLLFYSMAKTSIGGSKLTCFCIDPICFLSTTQVMAVPTVQSVKLASFLLAAATLPAAHVLRAPPAGLDLLDLATVTVPLAMG
jgi:hypothetical protein